LAPTDVDVLLTAAKAAQREAVLAKEAEQPPSEVTGIYERSLELYQNLNANQSATQIPDTYLGLGDVQLALGNFDQATLAWRNGLKRFTPPTIQITFLARIADSLLQSDRGEEARDTLNAIDTLVASLESSVRRDERMAIIQSQDLRRATWHMQRNDAASAGP
jgi:tetratricopeptide (TPR) repeat protein